MKIIGAILLITALLLIKHSLDALVSEAHIPFRLAAKISPIIDPIFSASIPNPEDKDKKEREVVDAAYSITLEVENRLTSFGVNNFLIGGIQSILGIYLLSVGLASKKIESTPRRLVATSLIFTIISLLSLGILMLFVLYKV